MGILDTQLIFDEDATRAVLTATPQLATNPFKVGDLLAGNTGVPMGTGHNLNGTIRVTDSVVGGASFMEVQLISSAVEAMTSHNVHWTTGPIARATLVAGYVLPFTVPTGNVPPWLNFVSFRYVASGANITAGDWTIIMHPLGGPAVHPGFDTGKNYG
ncbi:MAG: hypothetical protein DRQ55_11220 [Planctomycetota bacterium]|nr:MAG: hypothetical protein DRQ55_11220 [Planctomycetota bacterium]